MARLPRSSMLLAAICLSCLLSARAERSLLGMKGEYEQCGGKGGDCKTMGKCVDKVWPGATCPASFKCTRDSEWWWQCDKDGKANPPAMPAMAYKQCGGTGGGCKGSKCGDRAWPDTSCPTGFQCFRHSQYYWQCDTQPAKKSSAPKTTAPVKAGQRAAYKQCGGAGGVCKTQGACADKTWPGASCPTGFQCMRISKWYWQCDTTPYGQTKPLQTEAYSSSAPTPAPKKAPTPAPKKPAYVYHAPNPGFITTAPVSSAADIAAVTYPTPITYGPVYYGDPTTGPQQRQIPFRYNPLKGNPPRIRTGYYYLPSGWRNKALPVMVLFHGLTGYGLNIMSAGSSQGSFQDYAERYKFILIAPDSQSADLVGWRIPNRSQPPSPDMLHAQECLKYVERQPGVKFDFSHIAAAGVSNGGIMAAPLASRYPIYTHSMAFHAKWTVSQMHGHVHKIWISTGRYDVDVHPSEVQQFAKYFSQVRPNWPAITYNVNYLIPHTLQDPYELIDACHWWLNRGPYTATSTAAQLRSYG